MELFDVLFPEQAERMKELSKAIRASVVTSGRAGREVRKVEDQIEELEDDIGFLSLITLTFFATLHEQGVVTKQDFLERIAQIDAVDGLVDGKVSPEALRKSFGFAE